MKDTLKEKPSSGHNLEQRTGLFILFVKRNGDTWNRIPSYGCHQECGYMNRPSLEGKCLENE